MIDKRNGHKVVDKEYPVQAARFRLIGDPKAKTMEFAMHQKNLKLTFTDKPILPRRKPKSGPAEAKEGGDRKSSKTLDAIFKAMKKAVGG